MTPDDIIAAARACVGTPFQHQGRIPGLGLDCGGLLAAVALHVGCEVSDVTGYPRNPKDGFLEQALAAQSYLYRMTVNCVAPGDVVLLHFGHTPRHIAIVGHDTLIHAWTEVGKVAEHSFTAEWRQRVAAIYRFKDLA